MTVAVSPLVTLLKEQRALLEKSFEDFDCEGAQAVLELLLRCKGVLIFCGIGKSGYVAKKLAATFTSTGTRALFLSPIDALHGDLGMVQEGDCFIVLSKSGESNELVNLIPFIRNRKAHLIGFLSNRQSRLAKACDTLLFIPVPDELGPLKLVPTTSSALQMLIGDVLAVACMQEKGFRIDDFAFNHPAGAIGKRIHFKVKDLMLTGQDLPLANGHETLQDTIGRLSQKRCGCLLVVDDKERLVGIFTDGDLRRCLEKRGAILDCPLEELMTKTPRAVFGHTSAFDALSLMEANQKSPITVLPVIDEMTRRVEGLLKLHDVLQAGL